MQVLGILVGHMRGGALITKMSAEDQAAGKSGGHFVN